MSEDDILDEFGFNRESNTLPRGRGKVANMIGKKVGLYRCIAMHPDRKSSNNEVQWVVRCELCGTERVATGSNFRGGLRCMDCQGRPSNLNPSCKFPTKTLGEWQSQLECVKRELSDAMLANDLGEMQRLGKKLARTALRIHESM
jgi:hypothetical protein